MINKGPIDGKMCEVITIDQYAVQPLMWQPNYSAIVFGDKGYVYPIRNKTDFRPGCYPSNGLIKFKDPELDEVDRYSTKNITDFSKPGNIADVINKQNNLRQQEKTILTNADNIFQPQVKNEDFPAMIALKNATLMKSIDLDSYAPRFGNNYANDRRLYEKTNITLTKLIAICQALDIKALLTLEDLSPDVPNPMKDSITVELTSTTGGGDDE